MLGSGTHEVLLHDCVDPIGQCFSVPDPNKGLDIGHLYRIVGRCRRQFVEFHGDLG